jgi:hypothetical protein
MHATKLVLTAGSLLTLSLSTAAYANKTIDPFTTAFNGKQEYSLTTAGPWLWAGDAGTVSASQMNTGNQSMSVAGVSNVRNSTVQELTLTGLVESYVGGGFLSYLTNPGEPSGSLTLEYGPRSTSTTDLNLNLSGDGATAFALTIDGNMSDSYPAKPVSLTITVRNNSVTKSCSWSISSDGTKQFPFSCFSNQGIQMTNVDYIKFQFDTSTQTGIDYHLSGGLRTVGSPPPGGCH